MLCGLSAGSMCWFEGGITTSTGRPAPAPGLGLLPGSNSVHYGSEPARRPAFLAAVRDGVLPDGWGVDDGVGLLFEGTELADAVSARPRAHAVRVAREPTAAGVSETRVRHRQLPDGPRPGLTPPTELSELRLLRDGRPTANRLGARRAGLRD